MALKTVYASKDASALYNNDGWSGWDLHHPVGQSDSGYRYRSLIYFPISFTGMTAVTNAKLWVRAHRAASGNHVYGDSSGNTRTLSVRRVSLDWGEGTNRGETLWSANEVWGWSNRGEAIPSTNEATRVFTGYSHGTWYSIDVTGIVGNWFNGTANYGFCLFISTGETDPGHALEFYSRDSGAGYKPYLEITYDSNIAPTAPVSMSPTNDALVNTLAPTLTGTRADPDAGDYVTAFQMLVYADDATSLIWDSGVVAQSGTSSVFSKVYAGAPLNGNTFYRWMARTRDKGSAWGPYSAQQRFKLNTPPNPPDVTLTQSPIYDITTLTPTFNITHRDNDVGDDNMWGYRVVLTTREGADVWDSGDIDTSGAPVTTTSIVYSGPALAWQTNYLIKARTKDINGTWGAYSLTLGFLMHTAIPPVGLAPSNETVSNLIPVFIGSRQNGIDTISSYQILLYAEDGVTQIWDSGDLTTDIISGVSFSKTYAGTDLTLATTYKWKVRITSPIGGTSLYTALQSFTTPTDSTVPSLSVTPQTSGRVTSLTPTFNGFRDTQFTHYQIQLYPSTSTSANLGTIIWDSGDVLQSLAYSFARVYDGPALAWGVTYKWRARIGNPTLGNWTGLAIFSTDSAGAGTITAPANNAWLASVPTDFSGTSFGGESITRYDVAIWSTDFTVLYYYVEVTQAASSTFTHSVNLALLPTGTTFHWSFRYVKSTGPIGPFAIPRAFRLNGPPSIPTNLFPTPGYTFAGTLFPRFKAEFVDPDEAVTGDTPSQWIIEIRDNTTNALVQTKTISTGLNNGVNEYLWGTNTGGADTGLYYNTVYKWRTSFKDALGEQGVFSSYQTFLNGQPPVLSNLFPSNGSNIATVRPLVQWSYTDPAGLPQLKYTVTIIRNLNGVVAYQRTDTSPLYFHQVPAGYLQFNGEYYTIRVTATNSGGLQSLPIESVVQLQLNAPPPIESLAATIYEDQSRILLTWDASSLATNFVTYVIYRRDISESEWTMIGVKKPETNNSFNEWYAGQGVNYEYRVTVVKKVTDEPDIESPDSDIVAARLASDVWMVVGADRSNEHIFELPVSDESHNRPVQQEVFEPLGSNRKAVVRGFVLGHEGDVTVSFDQSESATGKDRIEYLLYYAGPHILKNPFGDVFDVTFGSPDYKYVGGGHLDATLTWIEVGATNNPGLSPDEFLALIGAE